MARTRKSSGKTVGGPAKRGTLPLKKVTRRGTVAKCVFNVFTGVISRALSTRRDLMRLKPQRWNLWCVFCRDGAEVLYECSSCPRVVCERCISLPKESQKIVTRSDIVFMCPECHEIRNKRGAQGVLKPYFGFEDAKGSPALEVPTIVNAHVELTSRSEICTAPILIINFVLNGVDPSGSPARMMQALLQSYIPTEDLHYHEVFFDFGTNEKFRKHEKSMAKLVNEVGRTEFDRVEVFVLTHSETTRGDIWGGHESAVSVGKGKIKVAKPTPVAYTVDDFFAGIFVAGLEEILKGATLWMLVCGHMVRETESFKSFTASVKRYDIENAFAFGAEGLHVCLTTPFIAAYVERVLVEGFLVQDVMTSLLVVCPRLAMHASIIHVRATNAPRRRPPNVTEYNKGELYIDDKSSIIMSTYTFFDENQRPWGNALPLQCSSCKCLRQWKRISPSISDNGSVAKFSCTSCKCIIEYERPSQSQIILFTQGYQAASAGGRLSRKNCHAGGSGWLLCCDEIYMHMVMTINVEYVKIAPDFIFPLHHDRS
ncbi:hypothetical protein P692DRAFT_20851448 [Suillus brevipes Sb2]|nr:hypothetical protein P692DRAFT_20851448 [Suillus brevipes Sb2]